MSETKTAKAKQNISKVAIKPAFDISSIEASPRVYHLGCGCWFFFTIGVQTVIENDSVQRFPECIDDLIVDANFGEVLLSRQPCILVQTAIRGKLVNGFEHAIPAQVIQVEMKSAYLQIENRFPKLERPIITEVDFIPVLAVENSKQSIANDLS